MRRPPSVGLALFVAVAFVAPAYATQLQVEGPQDSLAGAPTINHCTLRKAVINANDDAATYPQCAAGSGADEIVFLSPMTISLTLSGAGEDAGLTGDLDVTSSLTITGHPDGTLIDGAALDRVFHVHPGAILTLVNLHIVNGSGLGGGGGILVSGGTLNLVNVTISGCHAVGGDGGAIWLNGGTLNVTNSTISGNTAAFHAGAVVVDGGTATFTNTTITGNTSGFSNLTGGIRALGPVSLRNSIVAGNAGVDLPNLDGTFTSLGYNVIGNLGTMSANPTIAATTGDQIDVDDTLLHFGPLQNNGGPTPTHELLSGSIAIDQGHSSGSPADQRGLTRPCDLSSVGNAPAGDGADVGAFEVQGACATPNADPVAVADSATVAEDSGANVINVLANDTDADGDALAVTAVTQGAHGFVANNGPNVSYVPASNFFGGDSFSYTVGDGHGGTASATVTVNVVNVNDPPIAAPESYSINQDTTLSIGAPGVLGNDVDIDGPSLAAVLVTTTVHGSLTLNADGSFSYTPTTGFAGGDSFTYKANDGLADSGPVVVSIAVIDTQAPTIHASVARSLLWPPNHDLENVGFVFSASDNGGGPVTTHLSVFSDEDDVTAGGGQMAPDAKDIDSGTLRLRAERSGNGDGRVYLIIVSAADSSANTGWSCSTVVVPHGQSRAELAAVGQQAQAALASCQSTGRAPTGYSVVGDGLVTAGKQ